MAPRDLQIGTILRYTKFNDTVLDEPAWAVAEYREGDEGAEVGVCLFGNDQIEHEWGFVKDDYVAAYLNDQCDEFEIVPDDQVPDEVWTKLALLRLTGDAS